MVKDCKKYICDICKKQVYVESDNVEESLKQRAKSSQRHVCQFDLSGSLLNTFNSAKEAAQSFGRPKDSHIGDCCKGRRKTCFGYGWRYER